MNAGKTCIACGKELSAAAFNGSARTADGLARTCRACTNGRRRQRASSGGKRRPQSHAQSTIVATALRQGDIQTVQELLGAGLAPPWGWVCETMRAGHPSLAKLLLKSGVESNVYTMAAMGDVKGLSEALDRAPAEARLAVSMEPASTRVNPLHVGCASDWRLQGQNHLTAQVQIARVLHEHGAELNAVACYRGIANATPLLCACWSSGNLALVRWLLDQGAPATDADLLAALGHLQRHGRGAYDIAETLLAWGCRWTVASPAPAHRCRPSPIRQITGRWPG